MKSDLTERELNFIKQLLKTDETKLHRTFLSWLVPFINVILGSILFISVAVLFLNDPTPEHAKWVFLPGSVSGVVLLVVGLLLSRENSRLTERKKIAGILKKIVNDDLIKEE